MRHVGSLITGKRLDTSLCYALEHQRYTAGEIVLTPPGKRKLNSFEETLSFMDSTAAFKIPVFGSTWLTNFTHPIFDKALKLAARLKLVGVIARAGNIDTIQTPAHPDVPIYLKNGFGASSLEIAGYCQDKRLNCGLALDVGRAWAGQEEALFDEKLFPAWVEQTKHAIEVLLFTNIGMGEPRTMEALRAPLMGGEVVPAVYTRLLQAFPETPVLVYSPNFSITMMDCAIVHHMSVHPENYMHLPAGAGPHAGLS